MENEKNRELVVGSMTGLVEEMKSTRAKYETANECVLNRIRSFFVEKLGGELGSWDVVISELLYEKDQLKLVEVFVMDNRTDEMSEEELSQVIGGYNEILDGSYQYRTFNCFAMLFNKSGFHIEIRIPVGELGVADEGSEGVDSGESVGWTKIRRKFGDRLLYEVADGGMIPRD